MSLIGVELPGDDEYPIAWLNWTTWAIYAWIVGDADREATVETWISTLHQQLGLSSVERLVNSLAERLESAWYPGGEWSAGFPGWSPEPGQWRDGPIGVLDAAMQFAEWQQIAIRLLDDQGASETQDDQSERVIDDPEQLHLLEQALQPRLLHLVPRAAQDPSNDEAEPAPDEDSFFEEMLMETAATLGWLEAEGGATTLADEALRSNSTATGDDLVEAVADHLRDWVDRAAAPPGARRTHPECPQDHWIDGPGPQQTFAHWLMQAVIEDIDWWLLAKLLVHRAHRGS